MADMSPHVSTVFKELFDEIKSAKQQQWTITNYGALILAAIYWVKLPEVPRSQSKLKFLAIMTAVVGSGLLLRIQCNMGRSRRRSDKLQRTYFTQAEFEGMGLSVRKIRILGNEWWWRYFGQGGDFLVALFLVLAFGAIFVFFVL